MPLVRFVSSIFCYVLGSFASYFVMSLFRSSAIPLVGSLFRSIGLYLFIHPARSVFISLCLVWLPSLVLSFIHQV